MTLVRARTHARLTLAAVLLASSCTTTEPHTTAVDPIPGTILVLPPHNATDVPGAAEACLARITKPLTEHGYYVVPVARAMEVAHSWASATDLPADPELRTRLHRESGADAILQVTVDRWSRSYVVLDDLASVGGNLRLVDARTGRELWAARYEATDGYFLGAVFASSAGGPYGLMVAMLVAPPVALASAASVDTESRLTRLAQQTLDRALKRGLPPGPLHPDHARLVEGLRARDLHH